MKTIVYFDGLCPLCSREIEHYRKLTTEIRFMDITDAEFRAEAEGLDPRAIHRSLHAKDSEGRIRLGVDAFITIWAAIPRYRWAARLASFAPIGLALRGAYACSARLRPLLPRREKRDCAASPYCDLP
jgi:predicted DCC family thiol-disulfide oxidoreductase YuxK